MQNKRNNKKNGFTLMELLAAVVILGLIATIGLVAVNKVLEKSRKEYEEKQAKMVTIAAQSYFTDNKSKLPQEVLKTEFVKLQELISNNYIDEVVDYKKDKYDYESSITTVRKMAANRYVYYSKLIRQDGSEAVNENPEKIESKDIKIDLSNYKPIFCNNSSAIDDVYYINNKISIDAKINSTGAKIAAYKYQILKVDTKEKVYKKSENIIVDDNSYSDTIILDKKNIADGKYKLKVIAYDYNGNTARAVSDVVVIDATKPKCELNLPKKPTGKNNWYTTDIVYVQLNKKDNLSVTNFTVNNKRIEDVADLYTYEFTEEETTAAGKNLQFNVVDMAGNQSKCNINVKKDSVAPQCSTNTSHSGWINRDVILTGSCNDTGSGCVIKEKTRTIDYEINYPESPGIVEDNAGNETECEKQLVRIDKTAPTCTVISDPPSNNSGWNNTDVTIIGKCNDSGGSDCVDRVRKKVTTTSTVSPGIVEDNAGNKRECDEKLIQIDKTPPNVTLTRSGATLSGNAYDSGGSEIASYYFGTDNNKCEGKNGPVTFNENRYNGKTYYLCVQDKAGNKNVVSSEAYLACTEERLVSNSDGPNGNSYYHEVYSFHYQSNKCDEEIPRRYYVMTRIGCNCYYDKYWTYSNGEYKYYCRNDYGADTSGRDHGDRTLIEYVGDGIGLGFRPLTGRVIDIEYVDSDKGRDACKANNEKVFSYINKVCDNNFIEVDGTAFHGWKWFSGEIKDDIYKNLRFNSYGNGTTWYHTGGSHYDVDGSWEGACKKACMYGNNACEYDNNRTNCNNLKGEKLN